MKRIAIFLILLSGIITLVYFDMITSKTEAEQIALKDAQSYIKKVYNYKGILKVGKSIKFEESFSEDGPIPERWKIELLTNEGELFVTYWVQASNGRVQGYAISPKGYELLDPKFPVIVTEISDKYLIDEQINKLQAELPSMIVKISKKYSGELKAASAIFEEKIGFSVTMEGNFKLPLGSKAKYVEADTLTLKITKKREIKDLIGLRSQKEVWRVD